MISTRREFFLAIAGIAACAPAVRSYPKFISSGLAVAPRVLTEEMLLNAFDKVTIARQGPSIRTVLTNRGLEDLVYCSRTNDWLSDPR